MKSKREEMRKITVNLPASLLNSFANENLTETLCLALEQYSRQKLFNKLESARGKIDFGATWQELKYDR